MAVRITMRRDFLLVASASVAWGTVGVANQFIDTHSATNALSLAFWRLAIAAPLFGVTSLLVVGGRVAIKRRDMGVMVVMGGLQAIYQSCYSAAIPLAGVTVSTLVALCIAPVLVALCSTFLLRDRPGLLTLLALVGALCGTLLLVASRANPAAVDVSLWGVCLAFCSACGYAGFILCGRLLSGHYHPLHINFVAFASGALFLLGLTFFGSRLTTSYTSTNWLLLLYLGCIPTALAYALFQTGMRSLSATVVSIITLFEPLTAALLAWLAFHEELGPLGVPGALLLLGAMVFIMLEPAQH